jgi:peptidyl-prolyl cis-trans isomerase SurA
MAMLKYIKLIIVLTIPILSMSQTKIVDEVVAVIGEKIITRSELEFEISQAESQYGLFSQEDKCEMFENIMVKKLMLNQAEVDSISVTDDEVEAELDKKIRFFASQVGGTDKLENYLGKSILEYKNDIRPKIKDQKLVKALEAELFGNITVSHREVKNYFDSIPKDSLPRIEAEYEIAQLVIQPVYTETSLNYAYNKAKGLRDRVMKGDSFGFIAQVYSDDPGSAREGGLLPEFGRGDMVQEFEIAAFKLKPGEISPIFKSQYGYHFIQLIKRLGERVVARHVLIKPLLTDEDQKNLIAKLDTIKKELKSGKISFCQAVTKYSNVDEYRVNCGNYTDQYTGLAKVTLAGLEQQTAQLISNMQPGEYSAPNAFYMQNGTIAARIVFLKSETKAHIANMKQDYPRIMIAAKEAKKQDEIQKWVEETQKTTYTFVNSNYLKCSLEKWNNSSN